MTTPCVLAHGRHPGDIRDCIAALDLPQPHHSWYEPRPGSGLDKPGETTERPAPAKLHPLLHPGPLNPPAGIAIDEARLFWPWGSLYLIDEGDGGTRWSFWAFGVNAGSEPPDPDARRAIEATQAQPTPGLTLDPVDALLLQDQQRFFGITNTAAIESFGLNLLRRAGVVIGWTLTQTRGHRS